MPMASAYADYDVWNSRMNRYVRRDAKGIALLDESSGFPRLHYVFDVSDTGVRRNFRDPEVWQYNDDLKQNPAPDKAQNQMAWVQHMNSLKAQVEELVLTELIYS